LHHSQATWKTGATDGGESGVPPRGTIPAPEFRRVQCGEKTAERWCDFYNEHRIWGTYGGGWPLVESNLTAHVQKHTAEDRSCACANKVKIGNEGEYLDRKDSGDLSKEVTKKWRSPGDPKCIFKVSVYLAYNGWSGAIQTTIPAPLDGSRWYVVADIRSDTDGLGEYPSSWTGGNARTESVPGERAVCCVAHRTMRT
jgi:hypothetical protein